MERWCQTNAIGSLHGRCRVHHAEILRLRGSCSEAEGQALMACEELRPYLRRELGWPLNELGRIRLHKADFKGAEEALLAAHRAGGIPNPLWRWCTWPKETRPPRPPPYVTPSNARPRALEGATTDHRPPTFSARRCSRLRSRSRSRPATSAGLARPPTSWRSWLHASTPRRWSPAPRSLADECDSPTAMRPAPNRACPKRCDSGTRSVPLQGGTRTHGPVPRPCRPR